MFFSGAATFFLSHQVIFISENNETVDVFIVCDIGLAFETTFLSQLQVDESMRKSVDGTAYAYVGVSVWECAFY